MVAPGIEPGTLRIRLQPPSGSQPIGLIPSRDKGSPELSYVSKLETKTHRNNLVAEKAFGFVRSKKGTFLKNKHCAYVSRARRDFFLKKTLFRKTNIVLMCLVPAGALFPQKHMFLKTRIVLILYVPAGTFFSKKKLFRKTNIVLILYVPAGTFFPQKRHFSGNNKHCAYIVRARRGFFSQKMGPRVQGWPPRRDIQLFP